MRILDKIDRYLKEQEEKKGKDYKLFFEKKLKKFAEEKGYKGITTPDELSDKHKKEFFNMIDKEWKAEKETD